MTKRSHRWIPLVPVALFLLTSPTFAQTKTQKFHEFCASAEELKRVHRERPPQYADGDGDGNANDYLMQRIQFKDTVLEEWCINGGAVGLYIAWKLDGHGKPYKFIAKCSWLRGRNGILGRTITTNGILVEPLTITSTNPATGERWEYIYHPETGSIVVQKRDAEGHIVPPGSTFYPKEEPFSYGDLPPFAAPDPR